MNRSITLELKVGGVLTTGQASNITFRKDPYGDPADVIGGITVTEIGYGVYLASGFTTWYTDTQAYLSGTKIDSFGIKETGYIWTTFLNKSDTTAQTVLSDIAMSSKKITGLGAGSASGHSVRWEDVALLAGHASGVNQFTNAINLFDNVPRIATTRVYSGATYEIPDIKYLHDNYGTGSGTSIGVNANRLIVDSKQTTDVAGKIFNGIQEAITYAVTQTPSSTSRWTIYIMPHHSTGYAEDITIARFVDLIGWGKVYIAGGCTTTHVTTSQTWTARDARIENLVFNSTDKSYFFRLLHIKSCIALANGAGGEVSFYIDGSSMNDFGVFTQNDVDLQANNTEQDNKAVNCYGNEEPVWESTDDVGSFALMNTLIEL